MNNIIETKLCISNLEEIVNLPTSEISVLNDCLGLVKITVLDYL